MVRPTSDDAGHTITVGVKWSSSVTGASATAQSDGVEVAGLPEFDSAPSASISGISRVGETLTIVQPDWSPTPQSFAYQWLRDGAPIADATGSTYELTADDAGMVLSVAVTGTLSGYADTTVVSAGTAAVAEGIWAATG